jgi:DNA-binding transcriptional MerR regulator
MQYSIGEVANFLNVTTDTLRYYEKEGILQPAKNQDSGYRQYSFEDVFMLSDVLFYRNVGMSLAEIRQIIAGANPELEKRIIAKKWAELAEKLKWQQNMLIKMGNWQRLHQEGMMYQGRYEIRPMPRALRKKTYPSRQQIPMGELEQSIKINRDNAYYVTLSFCYREEDARMEHYFAYDMEVAAGLDFDFSDPELLEEEHPNCLFTVTRYQDDVEGMLEGLRCHARQQGMVMAGIVYGRQSITTYQQGQCIDFFRLYAPLK